MDVIIVKVVKYLFIIKYCYVMLSYLLKIQLVIYYLKALRNRLSPSQEVKSRINKKMAGGRAQGARRKAQGARRA